MLGRARLRCLDTVCTANGGGGYRWVAREFVVGTVVAVELIDPKFSLVWAGGIGGG